MSMKKMVIAPLAAALIVFSGAAHAAKDVKNAKDETNQVLEELHKINPAAPIDAVSKTDIDGIYEVVMNSQIFYFHPKTKTLFFGEMIRDKKSLTAERKAQIQALLTQALPLDKALKIGNGPISIVAFDDPDCPFCRKADAWLKNRQDVTLYIFMYPLPMHADAPKKARNILCSQNPAETFRETMAGKWDKTFSLPAGCEAKVNAVLDEHIKWGHKLGVTGTPAFWINGVGVAGADMERIEGILKQSAAGKTAETAPKDSPKK